jgi:phage-related protein
MAQEKTVRIVLIVGLIVLVLMIIVSVVVLAQNRSALSQATQNLEDAITNITGAFQQFASTVFSGLSRFVSKLRDFLASFINKVSQALAAAITYLTNVFSQIFRYVEHLANQLLTFFATLYFRIHVVVVTYMERILGKIVTIPINVGLEITLGFVTLVTGAIHQAFCFAVSGVKKFGDLLQKNVVEPILNFFTNPNNPIVKPIIDFFDKKIVNPINGLISDIKALPQKLSDFFTKFIKPLENAVNGFKSSLCTVCKLIPIVSCKSVC